MKAKNELKRFVVSVMILGGATVALHAQNVTGRKGLSEEQARERQTLIEKYDIDGDGILSKGEQKALSKKDKKALAKTGGVGTARKAGEVSEPKRNKPDAKLPPERRDSPKRERPAAPDKPTKPGAGGGNAKGGPK